MKKMLFALLFSLNALTNVYAQVPSWYNGDIELYNKFIKTCNIAQKSCPNETYNCNNVKSQDEFFSLNIRVGSCFLSIKNETIKSRDYTPSSAIGVASVRG